MWLFFRSVPVPTFFNRLCAILGGHRYPSFNLFPLSIGHGVAVGQIRHFQLREVEADISGAAAGLTQFCCFYDGNVYGFFFRRFSKISWSRRASRSFS